jgi:hypothetical protein
MANNYDYVVSTGVIVPDTGQIRADVESEWKAAFGQDLPAGQETPQGIMITMETENRDSLVRNNVEVANQINPSLAGGVWLDAIWALTGGSRRGATRSMLSGVEFRGVPGITIPTGSIATVEVSNARFATIAPITLNSEGFATGDMQSVEYGPVAAAVGSLTEVASSVLGWEQVTNPTEAVLGQNVESDIASRRRRRNTLALNSNGMPESIISRIYDVSGVRSLSFRENKLFEDQEFDGITLTPKSVYVCVEGGDTNEVAQALLDSTSVGPDFNGSVEVDVTDQFSGQVYPVKFDRPIERFFHVRVTAKKSPLDLLVIIPDAIRQYVNGELDGDAGLVVNQDLSAFEIAGAIGQVEPRAFISKVEVSEDGATWTSDDIQILLNEVARLPKGLITVNLV